MGFPTPRQPSSAPSGPAPVAGLSPDEFAARFAESFRKLWLIAVSVTRQPALADDAVQEAAVVALGKRGEFDPATSFTAWMGQIVRYVALNQSRRERKRRGSDVDPADLGIPAPATQSPDPTLPTLPDAQGALSADQPHFDDDVVDALQQLPETARACLLLRTIDGMEYSEIAQVLDIPAGTAMSHVHRARKRLREQLAGRTAGPSAPSTEARP